MTNAVPLAVELLKNINLAMRYDAFYEALVQIILLHSVEDVHTLTKL